jgi:hypothetical protein
LSYRLQIDDNIDFQSTFLDLQSFTGNQQVSGLKINTTYYWRVAASNAGGTGVWSDIWSFTTISGTATPALQASNLVVSGITGNSATVKWTKGNGSRSVVFVKQGTDGTPAPADNTSFTADTGFGKGSQTGSSGWYCVYLGSDSIVTFTGLSSRTTYKVMAISLNGNAGDEKYQRQTAAGNPVTFTTTCDFDYYGTNPEVHLYYKNSTTYDVEITNSHSCGTTTLKFQNISLTGSSFNITVNAYPNTGAVQGALSADGNSFSGTYNINYAYLHPMYGYAVSCGSKSGSWTASRKSASPVIPVLNSPGNKLTDLPVLQLLKWNPSEGAVSYSLQVSKSADFSSLLVSQNNITATEYPVSGLVHNTTYYWKVSAANDCFNSGWSEVWNFTTIPTTPAAPTLFSPADNSTNQPLSLSLAWNAANGADSYALQVSTLFDFGTTLVNQSGLTSTNYSPGGLANGTRYYWRVNATNAGGTSSWSEVRNYTTLPWVPEIPVLAGPAYGSSNQPLSFTVAWNPAERAESYSLQVSTQTDFSTTVINENNLTTTLWAISGLSNSTVYYWRVRAANVAGAGNWSQVWNFTTMSPVGIDKIFVNDQVRIYPNPANGIITVEFSQSVTRKAGITLYEPSGRMVLARPLVLQKSEIDISKLTQGIYFAEIQSETSVFIKKLIIF